MNIQSSKSYRCSTGLVGGTSCGIVKEQPPKRGLMER